MKNHSSMLAACDQLIRYLTLRVEASGICLCLLQDRIPEQGKVKCHLLGQGQESHNEPKSIITDWDEDWGKVLGTFRIIIHPRQQLLTNWSGTLLWDLRLNSQSQFRIHPYDHIPSYYEIKQLSLSGHISIYRNMTVIFPFFRPLKREKQSDYRALILFTTQ